MISLTGGQILLYGGFAIMGAAVVLGLVALVLFYVVGKRLKVCLEHEYGKKRH